MKPISRKLRDKMSRNPFMWSCIHSKGCKGTLTWEHAWIIKGQQVNEEWSIVPCCWKHNVFATGKVKRFNKWVALVRFANLTTDEKLGQVEKYPKFDFIKNYQALNWEFNLKNYPELEARIDGEKERREETAPEGDQLQGANDRGG